LSGLDVTLGANQGVITGTVLSQGGPVVSATISTTASSAIAFSTSGSLPTGSSGTTAITGADGGFFFVANADSAAYMSVNGTVQESIPILQAGTVTVLPLIYCLDCYDLVFNRDVYNPRNCYLGADEHDGLYKCIAPGTFQFIFTDDDDDTATAATCDFAFWDFLGRDGFVGDDDDDNISDSYHYLLQKNGLCYRNPNWNNGVPGLPDDYYLQGGGTDLGMSASLQFGDQSETVFFFGDFCRGSPGDPFGDMPSNWDPSTLNGIETGISYDAFGLQQPLPGGDNTYFSSILDRADPTRTILVCEADHACFGAGVEEGGFWVPTGSYYDLANNAVWLWYGQYIDGPYSSRNDSPCGQNNVTMRSSLIRVTPTPNNTSFTTMTPMNDNCATPASVFAYQYFIQVAPVPVHTEEGSNTLALPIHEYPEDGALIFGTSCDSNTYQCGYRNSSVYLGYFVPPHQIISEEDPYYANYHVYFWNGTGLDDDDDASPWTRYDPESSPDPADPTPAPIIQADVGTLAFGEISFQQIPGYDVLVMSAANTYASRPRTNGFELRIASMDTLTNLKTGLNAVSATMAYGSWGYGNYIVPASMALKVNDNGSGECHLYYDRVVSSWTGGECGDEMYGTAVIRSVAHIPAALLGLGDCSGSH
jgi:hypothetical protein